MGAYVSVPTWWRSLDARYRLVLGECPECGAVNFPPEGACAECDARVAFEEVEPAGTGTVVARTVVSGGVPPEFGERVDRGGPIGVAVVELDEGARVPAMLTDCDPAAVGRGDRVEAVVRRVYEQEGVTRYGYKFRPVD